MLPKRVPLQSFFSQGGNKMFENKTSEILSHESGKSGLEGIFFFSVSLIHLGCICLSTQCTNLIPCNYLKLICKAFESCLN